MKNLLFLLVTSLFFLSCGSKDESSNLEATRNEVVKKVIPENMKNKKIRNVIIPSKWIEISSDNIITIHIHVNNSDEDFEFKAKIGEYQASSYSFPLTFIGEKTYQGRNDYKPTEILSELVFNDIDQKFILKQKGFNTIKGKTEESSLVFK
jgi:hypothetical protein